MADYRTTGKELRKSPKGLIAGILAVLLLAGGIYGAKYIFDNTELIEDTSSAEESSEIDIVIPDETAPVDEDKVIYSYEALFRTDILKGDLMLVNRDYHTSDTSETLVTYYEKRNEHYSVRDTEVKGLPQCVDAFTAMTQAFFDATGVEGLQVVDGYRTQAQQKNLADKDKTAAGNPAKTPPAGFSEHETGLALDVNVYQHGEGKEFDGTGDFAWIYEHCAEYGFVLRYAADKVGTTQFASEPWHFRYVGVPHAIYMKENNLCLEEYLAQMQLYTYEGEHLELKDAEGKTYEAFYVPALSEDEAGIVEVPVPAECAYTLSGDNQNGFIVTVQIDK